jgi:hypothetical protein
MDSDRLVNLSVLLWLVGMELTWALARGDAAGARACGLGRALLFAYAFILEWRAGDVWESGGLRELWQAQQILTLATAGALFLIESWLT